MRSTVFMLAGACVLVCLCGSAWGQRPSDAIGRSTDEKEPVAVLEVGAAMGWELSGGAAEFAPNLAVEVTPIEGWLELEAGVSPFYRRGSAEWDTDLLVKKPWTFSKQVEFMLGVGPEWVHVRQGGRVRDSIAGELAGDFMFWPGRRHRFGWYLEPAYDYTFAGEQRHSVGMSAGLLIGVP